MNTLDPCPFLMRGFVGIKEIPASGADNPYPVNELAAVVAGAMGAGAMGAPADVVHLPARNEVQHAFSSHEKARRVFGAIEISRNLPPSWAQAVARPAAQSEEAATQ